MLSDSVSLLEQVESSVMLHNNQWQIQEINLVGNLIDIYPLTECWCVCVCVWGGGGGVVIYISQKYRWGQAPVARSNVSLVGWAGVRKCRAQLGTISVGLGSR